MEITPIRSITSLSYLVFMINCILYNLSWQFNSDFNIHRAIWSITLLSCLVFVIDRNLSNWSWKFSFAFSQERTYLMGHVAILSCLHNRSQIVRSILTVQYRIQRRSHMWNLSCHCPIWFSWYVVSCPIGHDSSVSTSR